MPKHSWPQSQLDNKEISVLDILEIVKHGGKSYKRLRFGEKIQHTATDKMLQNKSLFQPDDQFNKKTSGLEPHREDFYLHLRDFAKNVKKDCTLCGKKGAL